MSEITLHLDDALADKLQAYAVSHKTSIEEMAKDYFSDLLSKNQLDDVALAHQKDVEKRLLAYKGGEMATRAHAESQAYVYDAFEKLRKQKTA